jgi:hypothetical protein
MVTKKTTAATVATTASQPDLSTQAAIGSADGSALAGIPAATEMAPSGAPIQSVPDVDVNHPAVDNDPRKGTTVDQNRIDFNDPSVNGQTAVERNLGYSK